MRDSEAVLFLFCFFCFSESNHVDFSSPLLHLSGASSGIVKGPARSFSFPGRVRVEVKMTVLSIRIARRNAAHIVLKCKVLDRLPVISEVLA